MYQNLNRFNKSVYKKTLHCIQKQFNISSIFSKPAFSFLLLSLNFGLNAQVLVNAVPAVEGCPAINASHFKHEVLVGNSNTTKPLFQPIQLVPRDRGNGIVDIYFTERTGSDGWLNISKGAKLRKIDGVTKALTTIFEPQDFQVYFEHGLTGLAFDPNYKTNNWIYLFYSSQDRSSSIVRYEMKNDVVNPATKTVILKIDLLSGDSTLINLHQAGSLAFDDHGVLWSGFGDQMKGTLVSDKNLLELSGCTGNLHGSIFRIKPLPVQNGYASPGVGKTYTIPSHNFAEEYASLGSEYTDPNLVRPEIYAKGTRNPYQMAVHPQNSSVAWGDCGPDGGMFNGTTLGPEEFNLATKAGFYGYPYFAGDDYTRKDLPIQNKNAPKYSGGLCKGATNLPKASGPGFFYQRGCASGGTAMYFYDRIQRRPFSMPPHFQNHLFMADWGSSDLYVTSMKYTGEKFGAVITDVIENKSIVAGPLDIEVGPYGEFYFVNYGTGYWNVLNNTSISKLTYVGPEITETCIAQAFKKFGYTDSTSKLTVISSAKGTKNLGVSLKQNKLMFENPGSVEIRILSLAGRLEYQTKTNSNEFDLGLLPSSQSVRLVEVKTAQGVWSKILKPQ